MMGFVIAIVVVYPKGDRPKKYTIQREYNPEEQSAWHCLIDLLGAFSLWKLLTFSIDEVNLYNSVGDVPPEKPAKVDGLNCTFEFKASMFQFESALVTHPELQERWVFA
jgi:hypothetical protein